MLKSRLDPALSPEVPECGNDACAGACIPQHSTLIECIHAQARSVSNAIDVLDELLNRLEL